MPFYRRGIAVPAIQSSLGNSTSLVGEGEGRIGHEHARVRPTLPDSSLSLPSSNSLDDGSIDSIVSCVYIYIYTLWLVIKLTVQL